MTPSPPRTGLVLRAALGLLSVAACANARIGVPDSMATSNTDATRINSSPGRLLQDLDLPTLRTVGNNGGSGFPLGECEGDCDNNRECQAGLICVQRSAGDPVPGCVGSLTLEIDYCVKEEEEETSSTIAPTLQASVLGTLAATQGETTVSPTTAAPTEATTQAATTAAATSPPTFVASGTFVTTAPTDAVTEPASTIAPTLAATAGVTAAATSVASSASSTDALPIVTPVPTAPVFPLSTVGNDGNFPAYPLSICEGDCDSDLDVSTKEDNSCYLSDALY